MLHVACVICIMLVVSISVMWLNLILVIKNLFCHADVEFFIFLSVSNSNMLTLFSVN